ncbi:MAG: exodeoxyribonuclease VII small subunit [Pseudomonadota bacterium]|jgi:exodeoxyribonuclease VII small subunit|uniref:Exodeoxyribonuclease 7 small subunit n=1 Tax=Marisediminitalea aggregata TaxID=634436 RepID=A0A1M5L2D5_9ALTE|nr:exodeoxyribonuclease VII small subunit [Marisediminitalea aggregata]MAP21596.1 exodeoxyribonuclease VII small subunit [Alteromonadaceae bacterium]MCP3865629.1 exodeoxyribonuclease VII small subunit [Aestuariibacter sp.]MEC8229055.1 exodeoxyribonuclease VII small subunit [Pseudomonadota bacterium]MAX44985.1 exodeoxyribonuclease VII small subunit [Alteromonadaceae bacterium]MCP4238179.1 exodeoxyribonuclease VII small subunit [Aestuariibacter sp.]|tara:strand:+ start:1284 stop:1568 length:285 start_codon:yes stop_codon:yes gene_type:complete
MCPFYFGHREKTVSDKASDTSPTFEQTLSELEQIVNEMERGDLPLHDALKKFERGVELSRLSQQALTDAEQKVKILTEQGNSSTLQDFTPDDEL